LWDADRIVTILTVDVGLFPLITATNLVVTIASMNSLNLASFAVPTDDDISVTVKVLVERILTVLVISIDELITLISLVFELVILVESGTDVVFVSSSVDVRVANDLVSSYEIVVSCSSTD